MVSPRLLVVLVSAASGFQPSGSFWLGSPHPSGPSSKLSFPCSLLHLLPGDWARYRDPAAAPELPLSHLRLLSSSPSATFGSSRALPLLPPAALELPLGRLRLLPSSSHGHSRFTEAPSQAAPELPLGRLKLLSAPPTDILGSRKLYYLFSLLLTVHHQEAQRLRIFSPTKLPAFKDQSPVPESDPPSLPAPLQLLTTGPTIVPSRPPNVSSRPLLSAPSSRSTSASDHPRLCLGLVRPSSLAPASSLWPRTTPLGLRPSPTPPQPCTLPISSSCQLLSPGQRPLGLGQSTPSASTLPRPWTAPLSLSSGYLWLPAWANSNMRYSQGPHFHATMQCSHA